MKYNDYLLPDKDLVSVLNQSYNDKAVNILAVEKQQIIAQKKRLNTIAGLMQQQMLKFESNKKTLHYAVGIRSDIDTLKTMGIVSCCNDVGDMSIVKIQSKLMLELIELMLTDDLKFSKNKIKKILLDQAKIFNDLSV